MSFELLWHEIKRSKATWLAGLFGLGFFIGATGLRVLIAWDWLFAFTLIGLIAFPAMYGVMSREPPLPLWRRLIMALIASGVISFFVSLPWLFAE